MSVLDEMRASLEAARERDSAQAAALGKHELVMRRVKPFMSWQASCSCKRWEGAPHMNRPDAVYGHTVHVQRRTVIWA